MENTMNLTAEQQENLVKAVENLIEVFEQVWKKVKEIFIQLWNSFKEIIIKNQKVKKYLSIYARTHNQRIKKKQITKIRKILNEQCMELS